MDFEEIPLLEGVMVMTWPIFSNFNFGKVGQFWKQ